MFYDIIFFFKEFKNFLIGILNQIELLIKENKEAKFKIFTNQNKKFFQKFDNSFDHGQGKILVTCIAVSHPGFTITQMIIGKYLEKIMKLKAVGMLENKSHYYTKLFKSYNYDQIENFTKMSIVGKYNLFLKSKKILQKQKNIENFINYEVDGIKIGKIVYEHYIRFTGNPTIREFDFKLNYFLFKALEYNIYAKNLFKKKDIKYVVLSEKQFIPSGIIFQNALKNKSKIFARVGGPSNVGLRLFENENEFYKSRYNFSEDLVNHVYNEFLDTAVYFSDKILTNRFKNIKDSNIQDIRGADVAYKKKEKFTKKTLCEKFKWDFSKPIVVIFDHHYLDGLYDNDRLFFKDNLEWIASTLEFIKKVKDVNWLVKSHPGEPNEIHKSKTNTKKEFKKIIDNLDHVRLFPDNYSAGLLPNIASAVVTGSGSVGIEYPCYGIPCILANSSHYSGNGFTLEPQNKEEYFKYLNNISKLNKISEKTINKAKTFLFLEIMLGRVNIPLIPNYDIGHNFFSKSNSEKFWNECTSLLSKYNSNNDQFIYNLEKQIKSNNKHLINYSIIENLK